MTTPTAPDVVTVLSVDPGNEALIDLIEHWTAAGLLHPSLLVDESLLSGPQVDPESLRVRQVDAAGRRERLLRETIGARRLSLMRFVAVRPVVNDDRSGVRGDRLNAIADAFESTLSERTRFVRVNLVIPSVPGVQRLPTLLEPRWDVNVVISPEDRPNDAAIDHGVGRPDAYAPHAALACASIAGLWKHVPAAPFDEPGSSRMVGNHRRVVMARTAVRLVDNRDLSDVVINRIVRADTTALLAQDAVDHGKVRDSRALVEESMWAFRENVEKRPFDFHPLPEPPPPRPPLLKYTRKGFTRAMRQLVRRRVEDALAGVTGLTDKAVSWLAGSIPTFGNLDDSWSLPNVAPTPRRVHQMAQSAPGLLPRRIPAPGWAWRPLRQMCFGLVDGGGLPDEIAEIVGGRQPRVTRAEWIVPSPTDSFQFTTAESEALIAVGKPCGRVRATDLNAAIHVGLRLDHAVGVAAAPPPDPDDDDQLIAAAPPPLDPAILDTLQACRKRFRKWDSRSRSLSLIGQLTNHVNSELLKAKEDLEQRAREYQETEEDRARVHRLMNESYGTVRNGRRWLLPSASGSGVAAAGSLFLPWSISWALAAVLALPALVLGLWWGARMFRYLAREIRLEHRLILIEARRKAIVDAVQRWPAEADRLATVYDVLTDWGEIIGWMLHKPFGSGDEAFAAEALDTTRLPQAFQLAQATQVDAVIDRLVRRMADQAFPPAWLTVLYTELQLQFLGEHALGAENDPDYSPTLDPDDEDTQAVPRPPGGRPGSPVAEPFGEYADIYEKPPIHNARARLIRHFRDEECGFLARRLMAARIRQFLRRLPVQELAEKVTIQRGDDPEPEVVAIRDFLQSVLPMSVGGLLSPALSMPAFTLAGLAREKSSVDSVQLWCPESFDLTDENAVDPRVVVIPDRSAASAGEGAERHLVQVTRLDLSDDCVPDDIRILAEPEPDPAAHGMG
ncbi:hypothetical protein [Dactylosporangium sp. NPDC048998]|uniref:hypothetical protein n=1 Tax=Dactylosporangium sp. NPDC048998 TaxID=3363976 RepID=UPI003711216C